MTNATMIDEARVVALRTQLATDLRAAMKARDAIVIAAIRCVLSRLDNASAVDVPGALHWNFDGPREVSRRGVTWSDALAVLESEAAARDVAASQYDQLGLSDKASQLRNEASVIRSYQTAQDNAK